MSADTQCDKTDLAEFQMKYETNYAVKPTLILSPSQTVLKVLKEDRTEMNPTV